MSFTRNCPDCGKEQTYTQSGKYNQANRENRKCSSCARKGKTHSDDWRRKISEGLAGKAKSQEHKRNLSIALTGKTKSEEHRKNISVANGGKGELEKFCKARLTSWSKQVRERDEYVCQHCNHDFYPHECHAHHIMPKAKFPQYAYDVDNGITLCKECHMYEHKHYGRYR